MDDILHKYTAGEFLKWLSHEQADKYIETDIVSLDDENETAPIEKFSIEELSKNFIKSVQKYSVVKRGHILYIHNNKMCQDIMKLHFDEETYEHMQSVADELVESLNNRDINFIGQKHHCD